ncbi:serine/threonine protein kinase [Histoplasma ohiense]|nr:serine/threonine protein kinase [Histoplasma ohiense (nom. inval.)]
MSSSLFINLDGEPILEKEVLGYGRSGVVVLCRGTAIKIPLRHPWSTETDVELNIHVIQREQDVYRRLSPTVDNQLDGVVPYIELYPKATHLAHMKNGDLRAYLEVNNKPPLALQISWFRQMARALEQIHDRRVLIADIASRNFLLDSNLSVKFCDFTEASILPFGTAMETVDDNGYSIQTDIGQLGAVMYEVVTGGQRCQFDLFKDNLPDDGRARWPHRDSLPSTEGLWLGPIIERCWIKGGFQNAHYLSQALNAIVDLEHAPLAEKRSMNGSKLFPTLVQYLTRKPPMTALAFLGTLATVAAWAMKQSKSRSAVIAP